MKADLQIDGKSISIGAVGGFFQRNPTPGGHHYKLAVTGFDMLRYISSKNVTSDPITMNSALRLISQLQRELEACGELNFSASKLEFLLNSISFATFTGDGFVFEGVCSPIVRNNSNG